MFDGDISSHDSRYDLSQCQQNGNPTRTLVRSTAPGFHEGNEQRSRAVAAFPGLLGDGASTEVVRIVAQARQSVGHPLPVMRVYNSRAISTIALTGPIHRGAAAE